MCLVLSWKTGLVAIRITLALSAYNGVGCKTGTPSSRGSRWSHTISLLDDDMDPYSGSVEDLETVSLLHFHKIGELPKNIHHHVVERWVSGHSAQSASV